MTSFNKANPFVLFGTDFYVVNTGTDCYVFNFVASASSSSGLHLGNPEADWTGWKMLDEALLNAGLPPHWFWTIYELLKSCTHNWLHDECVCASYKCPPAPTHTTTTTSPTIDKRQTVFSFQLLTFALMINLPYAIMLLFVMQPPEGSKVLKSL